MTITYWCILISIIYPYIFTVLAKSAGRYDNADPRTYLQNLSGWRKRANAVQQNSFEINPAFWIAITIACLANTDKAPIDHLAMGYIATRVIYGASYVGNMPRLRSLSFFASLFCIFRLISLA
jgi:uncharacterized MAPEG superfamily protein